MAAVTLFISGLDAGRGEEGARGIGGERKVGEERGKVREGTEKEEKGCYKELRR